MGRLALIIFIVITCFLLGSVFFLPGLYDFSGFKNDSDPERGKGFTTKLITKKDLRTYRELDGILEYDNNTDITANGSGVLTYIAEEGDYLEGGSVLLRVFKSGYSADFLSWDQQLASSKASLSQAELALENLNKPATAAQIASAKASVSQAQLALENLNKPTTASQIALADASVAQAELALENLNKAATAAQIASADASVAQAELALENLNKPATASQIASADASVAQAEANVITAKGRIDVRDTARKNSRKLFCNKANLIGFRQWIYTASLCPADDSLLTNEAINTLFESLFLEPSLISDGSVLLTAHHDYNSAVASHQSAVKTMEHSKQTRIALSDSPSKLAVQQAEKHLSFTKEQRTQLNEKASAAAVNQAENSLTAAKEQRDDLNGGPSISAIKQAEDNLESASQYLAQLGLPPSDSELLHANAALESAKASIKSSMAAGQELVVGSSGVILMIGEIPAKRGFKSGISSGLDIEQLEQNLISMGHGDGLRTGADTRFDEATVEAIKLMQEDLHMNPTGHLPFGSIVFLTGPILVEFLGTTLNVGATVEKGQSIMSVVVVEKPNTMMPSESHDAASSQSTQRIITAIDVEDRDLISIEGEVQIELPDGTIANAWIESIGSIAIIPEGPQSSDPYFDVAIRLTDNAGFHQWTGSQVTVLITKELVLDTLAVEVTALLALLDGGYAIEVIDGSDRLLIPVELGIYSDGWVQIYGEGLHANQQVVIPE